MSIEYDNYLKQHIGNVGKGYDWINSHMPQILSGMQNEIEYQCKFGHDQSKYNAEEYRAYDAYFYGNNRSYQVVQDFNYAWLSHIHQNPHHWQYWILVNDDPNEGEAIIDMDYEYIIEMICDWWAFSWKKGELYEIFSWYDQHKAYIKLSDKTRKTVEDILDKIREKLDEGLKER